MVDAEGADARCRGERNLIHVRVPIRPRFVPDSFYSLRLALAGVALWYRNTPRALRPKWKQVLRKAIGVVAQIAYPQIAYTYRRYARNPLEQSVFFARNRIPL